MKGRRYLRVASLRLVTVTAILGATPARAVSPAEPAPAPDDVPPPLAEVVRANLESSWLVYPIGVKGLSSMVFETGVVPHFSVLPRSWHVALFLTPKIVLRMFAESSVPVKTPSYMPRLMAYFWFDEGPRNPTVYFSAGIGHHSNGQAGPFYLADGSHNHEDASFETNELRVGAYPVWWKSPLFGWNAVELEWHPRVLETAELRHTYGDARLHLATKFLRTRGDFVSDLSVELVAILGDLGRPTNASPFFARFPLELRYEIRPDGVDVGAYAFYYQGQDYYNIWYDRFVSMFGLGISGTLSTGFNRTR